MNLTNLKLNLKNKLHGLFSNILPLILILSLVPIIIFVYIDGTMKGFKFGESTGIKQTTTNYQKDLIERNLAVYDGLTGQWTMLDSNQIVDNLIKNKKININSFTPIGVSGIKECNCIDNKDNKDKLFDFEAAERLDLNKIATLDKKSLSKKSKK